MDEMMGSCTIMFPSKPIRGRSACVNSPLLPLPVLHQIQPANRFREQRGVKSLKELGIKKPNRLRLGDETDTGTLSLERLFQTTNQAGFLTCGIGLLSAPSQGRNLSGPCRFRSAHSCGAAMELHHLP